MTVIYLLIVVRRFKLDRCFHYLVRVDNIIVSFFCQIVSQTTAAGNSAASCNAHNTNSAGTNNIMARKQKILFITTTCEKIEC